MWIFAVLSALALSFSAYADPKSEAGEGGNPIPSKPKSTASLRIPHCKVERDYRDRPSRTRHWQADMYHLWPLKLAVSNDGDKLRVITNLQTYVCAKNEEKETYGWKKDDSRLKYYSLLLLGEESNGVFRHIWSTRPVRVDGENGAVIAEAPLRRYLSGKNREKFNRHENIYGLVTVAVADNDGFVGRTYSRTNQIAVEGLRITFNLIWDDSLGRYRPQFDK